MKLLLPIKKRLPVVLGLFVLVLVAATACASDDSSSAPVATPAQAPNASAANSAAPPVAAAPVVAQAPEPTAIPTIPPSLTTAAPRPTVAPAKNLVPELTNPGEWINSEPLTLEGLRSEGKVVLIDFWTYTCINCIRTLPYLREWHEKYADKGLVILGVHTPEFEFEHVYENVAKAVGEFGLEYPIVQDNDFGTWRAFDNRFWPAKYLIDTEGVIRYEHFGEGSYDETEEQIREILMEAGYDLEGISVSTEPEPEVDADSLVDDSSISRTRELYAGYERNYSALRSLNNVPYVRHVEFYEAEDEAIEYTDPGVHENHFMYLQGLWMNHAENLVHAQTTKDYEDYIALKFYATSVNVVMAPNTGEPYQVQITVDDAPVAMDKAGADIQYDDHGNSFVHVDGSRIYYLVDQSEFAGGEMKLSSNSSEFSLFAFTFGSYEGGEPVKEG